MGLLQPSIGASSVLLIADFINGWFEEIDLNESGANRSDPP